MSKNEDLNTLYMFSYVYLYIFNDINGYLGHISQIKQIINNKKLINPKIVNFSERENIGFIICDAQSFNLKIIYKNLELLKLLDYSTEDSQYLSIQMI